MFYKMAGYPVASVLVTFRVFKFGKIPFCLVTISVDCTTSKCCKLCGSRAVICSGCGTGCIGGPAQFWPGLRDDYSI